MKRTPGDFSFEKFKKRTREDPEDLHDPPAPRRAAKRDVRRNAKGKRFERSNARRESFRCKRCKAMIGPPLSGTTQRNHCPACLFSMHLDYRPGDRNADCGSSMEPISIWVRGDEWVLLHRCMGCGVIHANRIAPDDSEIVLLSLAARPLGKPAFPLYATGEEEA